MVHARPGGLRLISSTLLQVVVSPDVGGVARARAFAKKLNDAPLAIVDKRRSAHNISEVMNLIGDVKDKVAVLVDDMIDTAGMSLKDFALLSCFAIPRHKPKWSACMAASPITAKPALCRHSALLCRAEHSAHTLHGQKSVPDPTSEQCPCCAEDSRICRHNHECSKGAACGGRPGSVCLRDPRSLLTACCREAELWSLPGGHCHQHHPSHA